MLFAQPKEEIYLGPDQSIRYQSCDILKARIEYPLISFFNYKTFKHHRDYNSSGPFQDREINRLGLILNAKSTDITSEFIQASFGNLDTAEIYYKFQKHEITRGRSALTSILNLFSKEKDPQDEPYTYTGLVESTGSIRTRFDSATFLYAKDRYHKHGNAGWIISAGDTLHISPIEKRLKRGKIKKRGLSLPSAFVIKKNESIIAAFDNHNNPPIAYFSLELDAAKKLLLAAYIFIAASY
jgi:hypothetical protein